MPEFGSWLNLPSPQIAEMMAKTGFDFIIVDLEHGVSSIETAQLQIMSIKATNCRAIVRIPEASEAWVKRILDAGAQGVMVPRVESAAEAEEIVSWAFYAPKGKRGDALRVLQATAWGREAGTYKKAWNDDGFLAVQIESVKGLANIEEIAAVEGVTQLFFGPSDYSNDAGVSFDSEETLAAGTRVAEVAKAYGLKCGSVPFPLAPPKVLAELGFTHITVAGDIVALTDSFTNALECAREER